MRHAGRGNLLADLRRRIEGMEGGGQPAPGILPFGVAAIDRHLPGGGLRLGALHELADAGGEGAFAPLFAAGILARRGGPVLWCLDRRDLFAPALASVGLHPDRVVYAETHRDAEVLALMEEGLRHPGLAWVVGETGRLGLTPSRRLHLAAETSGATALVIRRAPGRAGEAAPEPSAAVTRWRIGPAPSRALDAPGLGRGRWQVELVRCRGAEPCSWLMEACDAKGRLAPPADLADGSLAPGGPRRAAAG